MVKQIKVTFECKPSILEFKTIPVCSYIKTIEDEVREGSLTRKLALELLEQMYMV